MPCDQQLELSKLLWHCHNAANAVPDGFLRRLCRVWRVAALVHGVDGFGCIVGVRRFSFNSDYDSADIHQPPVAEEHHGNGANAIGVAQLSS